jgi:hypothetical protein
MSQQELIQYFTRLTESEQQSIMNMLKRVVEKKAQGFPVSLEEYNTELENADAEIENGDFILHEDVKKKFH